MSSKLFLIYFCIAAAYFPSHCIPDGIVTVFGTVQNSSSNSNYGCGKNEECILAERCAISANEKIARPQCLTAFRMAGVCCLHNKNNLWRVRNKRCIRGKDFDQIYLNAVHDGRQTYAKKLAESKNIAKMSTGQQKPYSYFHQLLQPGHDALEDEKDWYDAYENVYTSKQFAEMTNMSIVDRQLDRFEPKHQRKRCLPVVQCNPHYPYRSIHGACNNLHPQRTSWGAVDQPFKKLFPPAYEDGVWAPRLHSISGRPLASARTICATLLQDVDRPDPHFNILLMQFGQFVVHDFAKSITVTIGKKEVQCCTADGSRALQGDQAHFACMPIDVSPHDPFYSKFGVRCLNFVRLVLASDGHCRLGYAKQANKVTHFIDASMVYGSTDKLAASLRAFQKGQLRNSFPVGIEMLPFGRNPDLCEPWAKVCFDAGEDRSNEVIPLAHLHTLFLREHNRIANTLNQLNPHWDDETLYQETRKIVIAVFQHIVFNEYLPIIVGLTKAKQYGLLDDVRGHSNVYNDNLDPTVLTEVSAAAFRFGHSTVDSHFHIQHRHAPAEDIFIHSVFNNPSKLLYPTSFDDYMFSIGSQSQQQLDGFFTTGVAGLLFAGRAPFGSDLPSLNVQRGRDHAVRPYNEYREWAGLPKIKSFHELGPIGSEFAKVYESPDDIDLWIGGLFETAVSDGLLGETFAHLIADQFARLKYGDRFYYTNSLAVNPGAFTSHQLEQIQQITLAGLICANIDQRVDFYQAPNAFLKSGPHNLPIPCNQYHSLDLEAWRY